MSMFELRTGSPLVVSNAQSNAQSNATFAKTNSRSSSIPVPLFAWWGMFLASATALCTSCYLAWASITSSPVAGCSSGSVFDCSHVLHSRWSTIFSIPVSVPAIATHLLLLSMLLGKSIPEKWQQLRWGLVGFACLSAAAAALWFIGLQVFWIEHLCPYCMIAHTGALILGGLFLWSRPVNTKNLRWVAFSAVGGISGLILLQSLSAAPQTHEIIEFSTSSESESTPDEPMLFEAPAPQPQASLEPKRFDSQLAFATSCVALVTNPSMLLNLELVADADADETKPRAAVILNSIKLETNGWPLLGKADAELVFVELFDYTCEHCQRTHKAIEGARQKFGDRLAIIALPVPMDGKCNPNVKTSDPKHAEACDLAKLAVALWYVEREKFAEFHHYLFEKKPNYAAALIKAKEMVDNEKLATTLSGTIPSEYIAKHIALYAKAGAGNIPKLMFPKTSAVGAIESTEVVVSLIDKNAK